MADLPCLPDVGKQILPCFFTRKRQSPLKFAELHEDCTEWRFSATQTVVRRLWLERGKKLLGTPCRHAAPAPSPRISPPLCGLYAVTKGCSVSSTPRRTPLPPCSSESGPVSLLWRDSPPHTCLRAGQAVKPRFLFPTSCDRNTLQSVCPVIVLWYVSASATRQQPMVAVHARVAAFCSPD